MTYGYTRVSTRDQNEARQIAALTAFGVAKRNIFMDKLSGKDFNRFEYLRLTRKLLKKGDLLVVKSIDRLGRNYQEILEEWRKITKELGSDIKILDIPLLDTTINKDLMGTFISDVVLQLLSFVAQNERETILQRQREGITIAKSRGVKFGRPKKTFPEGFEEVFSDWSEKRISPGEAFRALKLPTVKAFYGLVERYKGYYGKRRK